MSNTLDPVVDVVRAGVLGDGGQRGVQQGVAGGSCVEQHELIEIRVDAVLDGQVHQHGPGQHVRQRLIGNLRQAAGVFVKQEQQNLFGKSQHVSAVGT